MKGFFDAFCVIFRAPPVVLELSASFRSFRALTPVSARGLLHNFMLRVCDHTHSSEGPRLNNNNTEEKEEEEEEVAESWWAASSWSRWLPCPLLFWGARGVPAPQTMDFVEEIPLVRVFVEQIVVCQCHRSWRFSSCRRSRRKSWRCSAGDKVVDMLVIVQRQVLGETEQKTEGSAVPLSRGRPVLGQGC